MERCTHDVGNRSRLGEALGLLTPQSRRLMELWLDGLGRAEIAAEMRLCESAVSAVFEDAFRQVRGLLRR